MRKPSRTTALGLIALCACSAPGVAPELLDPLRRTPDGGAARVALTPKGIVEVSLPVAETEVPAVVRRTAEALAPGGQRRIEHLPGDGHYRVDVDLGEDAAGRFRSVRLTADGTVVERSHSLPVDAAPAAIVAQLRAAVGGALERVDVVQTDTERYRALGRDADGGRWLAECARGGGITRRVRIRPAALWIETPQ